MAEWVQSISAQVTIRLCFGALGGALAGLISALTRYKIDVDREPWPDVIRLLVTAIISIGSVISAFFIAARLVLYGLALGLIADTQQGFVTAIPLRLVILLPALNGLRLISAEQGRRESQSSVPKSHIRREKLARPVQV